MSAMAPPSPLLHALTSERAADALRSLDEAGYLTRLLPELEAGRRFFQPELHYYDVLDHNLAAVAAFESACGDGEDGKELRETLDWTGFVGSLESAIDGIPVGALTTLACLVHDVAKPATAVYVEGRLRFPRHGPRGAEMMRERLPALGFGPAATDFVARLVRYHLRPGELIRSWPVTDRAVRKFVADLDGHVLPLMLLNLSDGMATRGPTYTREQYRRHVGFVNYVVARSLAASEDGEPPILTGDDLLAELNLESGRLLGAVLTSVRRAQLEGSITGRDEALALARSVAAVLRAEAG
jgi:HD domain